MSLPDYLLEPDDESVCTACGEEPVYRYAQRLCSGCWVDMLDEACDTAYEDAVSQKGKVDRD